MLPPDDATTQQSDRSDSTPLPVDSARRTLGSSLNLRRVMRKNLLRLLLSLVVLGVLAAATMLYFRAELDAATALVFDTLGLSGVVGLIFITDSLISPLPPDTLLMLIAASQYADDWLLLIPAIGCVSTAAGIFGYTGGRLLSKQRLAQAILEPFHTQSQELVVRYGGWAVAVGALTPIPFSITCWSAGLLEVPFKSVWPPCLLRIPRYILYYLVIALGSQMGQG